MQDKAKKVVTRFAPSPTGFMHVGGIRTALYAWLLAKKHDGEFILRIEDTDKEREVEGSIDHIKKCLQWLGLDWTQGPDIGGPHGSYIQSERLNLYRVYAEKLIEKGLAYADPTTEEEIEALRKSAEEEKRPFLFRNSRPNNPPAWNGSMPLRFKVTNLKKYVWNDLVWGELSAGPEALDDFILIKSDGYPTYNFAHIIDDIEMQVTHVMRGQEFISSTPKFLSIYDALDVPPPFFATLPPIMAPDGKKKLSKRDGAKDILEYEKEGYLPETMVNFLALLGWNPGTDKEVFTPAELVEAFDLSKVQHHGAGLNEDKLNWLNKEHMKLLSEETKEEEVRKYLNKLFPKYEKAKDNEFIKKVSPVILDHITKWGDIDTMAGAGELDYYFDTPKYDSNLLFWKWETDSTETKKHLETVSEKFKNAQDEGFSNSEKIKSLVFDYATEVGRGKVLWPLRVALSGKDKSPDPFSLSYILGKEETLKRIEDAIVKLS